MRGEVRDRGKKEEGEKGGQGELNAGQTGDREGKEEREKREKVQVVGRGKRREWREAEREVSPCMCFRTGTAHDGNYGA